MHSGVTYVTCMYNNLHGTVYGGRNRFNMYIESMRSLSKLNANIICFTSESEIGGISKALNSHGVNNVNIEKFDIFSQDYHAFIMRMKESNPSVYIKDFFWENRSPHVMWGKTRMIRQAILNNPSSSKFFWIDAGLSSSSIIRHRYFPLLHEQKYYYSEGLFGDRFTRGLVSAAKDKIFALLHTRPNNQPIPKYYNLTDYTLKNCAMIGGLFGGDTVKMVTFCDAFDVYIDKMDRRNEMFSEESIYSGIYNDNTRWFQPFYFNTFYHEDWPNTNIDTDITFSSILEGLI